VGQSHQRRRAQRQPSTNNLRSICVPFSGLSPTSDSRPGLRACQGRCPRSGPGRSCWFRRTAPGGCPRRAPRRRSRRTRSGPDRGSETGAAPLPRRWDVSGGTIQFGHYSAGHSARTSKSDERYTTARTSELAARRREWRARFVTCADGRASNGAVTRKGGERPRGSIPWRPSPTAVPEARPLGSSGA